MLRKTIKGFTAPLLILALVTAFVDVTQAQSPTSSDVTIQEGSLNARARVPATAQSPRRLAPCQPKRRALVGAVIGFVAGMIVVRRAAAENDGTVGAKTTLQAGAYGAALGALVGGRTCR